MTPSRSLLAAAACLLATASLAQTSAPAGGAAQPGVAAPGSVGSTATGAPPEKTGSTTAIGQTKPPGAAVGDGRGTRPDLEEKSRDLDRKINTGICTGCK